jgi:DNA-binding MarR family transcriptional regulator
MADTESPLQRELRQTRPFRSRAHEATVALMRTADVLSQAFGKVVDPTGLTAQQYNVLRILRGAGEAGLPTLEIAERMIERAPGITRLLDRLEQKELVRRERCPGDRRQVLCWPTASALALLAKLDPEIDELETRSLAALPQSDQQRLIDFLDLVRAAHPSCSRDSPLSQPVLHAGETPAPSKQSNERNQS